MTTNIPQAVEIESSIPATASIIWLHGLGADGHDFEAVVPALSLPHSLGLRFIFPHAPYRPVTVNNGYVMRAWYDIFDATFLDREDADGIQESRQALEKLIERETGRGMATSRIILAGFSQGGAIALYTGLRYSQPLAGIMALSTYLPLAHELEQRINTANKGVPILMAHGTQDTVVPYSLAIRSKNLLEKHGYGIKWRSYPIGHTLCPEEIVDISAWITRVLEYQA